MFRDHTNHQTPMRVFTRIAFATVVALTAMLAAGEKASAQPRCGPHAEIAGKLSERYAEALVAIGFADNGRLIEVFSSADGKTWTILTTTPSGTACIAATGQDWEARKAKPTGPQA